MTAQYLRIIYNIYYKGFFNKVFRGKMRLRYNNDFKVWRIVG